MMADGIEKKVDESWKEQAEREKARAAREAAEAAPQKKKADARPGPGDGRFESFLSSLVMEALVSLGEMPHPATGQQGVNLQQGKYIVDILGMLEEKTEGNLTAEEQRLLRDSLYQLRMRYLALTEGQSQSETRGAQ